MLFRSVADGMSSRVLLVVADGMSSRVLLVVTDGLSSRVLLVVFLDICFFWNFN